VLNFDDAAYEPSEQPPKPETAADLVVALYHCLQAVKWGNARVNLVTVAAKGHPPVIPFTTLDIPIEVASQLNSVLERCLFGAEGDALSAQIKETFDLFTKEERAEKLRLSQSELFGGGK
jgi:hypothetical protein